MNALAGRLAVRVPRLVRHEAALPLLLAIWVQADVFLNGPPFAFGNMVGPAPIVGALYAVTSLALVWRRRAPLAVLAFIVALDSLEYLAYGAPEGLGSFLPLFFATYCVGRYRPGGSGVVAVPLCALGIGVHEMLDPEFAFGGANAFFWLVLATAWPLGQAFRRRAAEAEALAGQARELAASRERAAHAAVSAERTRIARELHDVVGHGLSVIVLQLVGAVGLLERGDTAAAYGRLQQTERSARDALAEMRRLLDLVDDGRTDPLAPRPGLGQLERLLADTRAAGGDVDLTVTGDAVELPPGVDLAAFRILQESLTNVLKHADPPRAHVRLAYERTAVVVHVADEGNNGAEPAVPGRGLAGMRERVSLYGGELHLGRGPEGGYVVEARLPVRA